MSNAETLPRWDLSAIFPGFESSEFCEASSAFAAGIDNLTALFERYSVYPATAMASSDTPIAAFESITTAYNDLLTMSWKLEGYCFAQVATDSNNNIVVARWNEYERHALRLELLRSRFSTWLADLNLDELIALSTIAASNAGPLRILAASAHHQMSPVEESLVTELSSSGGGAWSRLYQRVWSGMNVAIELEGERHTLPMSRMRGLASAADRDTRRHAYEAEQRAWWSVSIPLAAALNGVKGQKLTLAARRGWPSLLDEACTANGIDMETLDAMFGASRESLPDFRRYLRAKATALDLDRLAWFDLQAPIGDSCLTWPYEATREFILHTFGTYSEELRSLAERAFAESWLDLEPRVGKQGGAFCIAIGDGTSRLLANFAPVFSEVRTLAHELGHAYHFHVQHREERTILQRILTPMTLAETASTFCETLIRQAAIDRVGPVEQATLLDAALQDHCRFVVDVSAGFLFEQRTFEMRRHRDLSIEEFNALMVEAQAETYGDAVDSATYHPFMWAYRPHYFSASSSFSSFPYMFGLLFGIGLYRRYLEAPTNFLDSFEMLLAATGEIAPATLAARFGIDIRTPAFWKSSLEFIREDIDRFELLVAQGFMTTQNNTVSG